MRGKRIIFGLFYLLFSSAIICKIVGYNTYMLNGEFSLPGEPEYTTKSFLEAKYQDAYAEYIRTHNPVYNELIRINNQFKFSFFYTMPAGGTVVGKNNVLFDRGRIQTFYGEDYMGQNGWNYYMDIFDFVSDTLHKLNKPIIYVNVGDKPRIMEKYIPDEFIKPKPDSTNYNLYLRKFKNDNRLTFIDMAGYFIKIRDTSKVELYPNYSIHWSMYSVYLATDSIAKYVNKLLPQYEAALPALQGFNITKKERDIEYELLHFLNMYYSFPKYDNHYPLLKFMKKTHKKKPRVFVIGDSFGQMINDFDYLYEAFDDSSVFIRYNAEYKKKTNPYNLINIHNNFDYWKEFEKADAVIFVSSELNLSNFGFTFFEKAYDHYKGIDNFIDSYHTQSVIRNHEGNHYVFTIKKGVGQGTYLKNRNPNAQSGKTYRLSYMEKGKGELTMDFYPDFLPQTFQVYDTDEWKEYTWQFTMPKYDSPGVVLFRMYLDSKDKIENEMQFKNFKLEEVN